MAELTHAEIFGAWVSIFLTLALFSFLYDDNPIYKVTEHVFMGISIGYGVVEIYMLQFEPNLIQRLAAGEMIYLIPLILAVMLMFKVSRRNAWIARIPIALLVASFAAVKITGETSGKLILQLKASLPNLEASWRAHGFWDWQKDGAGIFSDTFLVLGLMACLIHFYFSEVGPKTKRLGVPTASATFLLVAGISIATLPDDLGAGRYLIAFCLALTAGTPFLAMSPFKPLISRLGIFVLMLSFGASFGYTVMGRISLAIGRGQELLGLNRPAVEAAQINPRVATLVSLAIIILGLFVWRKLAPPATADN
ncbi:MAG: hypothetical protein VX589_01530 [Myxococcota bacterium]|nr:hypothetical protein [Myxococcota bacterium]